MKVPIKNTSIQHDFLSFFRHNFLRLPIPPKVSYEPATRGYSSKNGWTLNFQLKTQIEKNLRIAILSKNSISLTDKGISLLDSILEELKIYYKASTEGDMTELFKMILEDRQREREIYQKSLEDRKHERETNQKTLEIYLSFLSPEQKQAAKAKVLHIVKGEG